MPAYEHGLRPLPRGRPSHPDDEGIMNRALKPRVDRRDRRPIAKERPHELGEAARNEFLAGRVAVVERPPPKAGDVLRAQVGARRRLVLIDADEPDSFRRMQDAAVPGERRVPSPKLWPELRVDEADLLGELAAQRFFGSFSLGDAAARCCPPHLSIVVLELDEENAVAPVEHDCTRGGTLDRDEPLAERGEPPQACGI